MEKAFRYRFYPTPAQENLLRRTVGCVRLVYNKALAYRTESFYNGERIGYNQTSAALTQWKKQEDLSFLNEVSSVPLQQCLRHLQSAYTNFFEKRASYPQFKKKRNGGSATFTRAAFSWKDGKLYLAKCSEPLAVRWSRQLPRNADPSSVTVRLTPDGKWFVSILCDIKILPLPRSTQEIGLDMGVSTLVTGSDGTKVANPNSLRKALKKLKQLQKSLSRKEKGSNNRRKARLKLAKHHAHIANIRKDHLHKTTTQLIRENQTIVVESLNVKGMMQNHKLTQAISDASWGELVRQLEYKAQWYGRNLIQVDQWFPSSKRCSNCGYISPKMPLNVREWDCPKCNTHHDRDINAAVNLLAVGQTVTACGATVRPKSSKDIGGCNEAGTVKPKSSQRKRT
ncbi:transposase, IS605 OrfB family [Gloeocapsa sp. PCC 7428]|uniref:RNA-guided endonuclease InsQ/TnpB family protein n=1 Tax=Gloeocapsa sp. PCC 7428 TaxID=1173026 RepID=UPI0002A61D98|nr:RNA-guided endonuclease TnpB family protein [Gloeocapsa sp. PCC 7428]AFZ30617.1 transposase, IS605 OrfB family [Gloeocapsa sp. PCC 7428]